MKEKTLGRELFQAARKTFCREEGGKFFHSKINIIEV
jgi:hypothetical protein